MQGRKADVAQPIVTRRGEDRFQRASCQRHRAGPSLRCANSMQNRAALCQPWAWADRLKWRKTFVRRQHLLRAYLAVVDRNRFKLKPANKM